MFLADMNLRIWKAKAGLLKKKDAEGKVVTLTKEQADLDIYVCIHVHNFRP